MSKDLQDERVDNPSFIGLSNCCEAPVYGFDENADVCSHCGEHCEVNRKLEEKEIGH